MIDGLGNDDVWANAPMRTANVPAHRDDIGPPGDETDVNVTWKGLWDDDNLYVLAEVTDDVIINDDSCDFNDDSIEIYIDAQNTDAYYAPISEHPGVPAFQFTMIADNPNSPCEDTTDRIPDGSTSAFTHGANSYGDNEDDTQYVEGSDTSASVITGDNTVSFEMAFPWEALEATPEEIMANPDGMGFMVTYNDDDDFGGRDGQTNWVSESADGWHRADIFPQLQLEDAAGEDCLDGVNCARSDINQNGSVDFADFVILSTDFGKSSPHAAGGVANIPAPAGLVLLTLGGLLLVRRRRS